MKFFYKSFNKNPQKLINKALVNIVPLLNIKQLKQGNSKNRRSSQKEFPYIIKSKNRISSALNFFFSETKTKAETKLYKKLISELAAAAQNTGVHLNKKKNLYEYALLKKKYFYYR